MANSMNRNKEIWYKIRLTLLDIEGGGTHLAVKCKINGIKSVLLIDTGASNSVFDRGSEVFLDTEMLSTDDNGMGSGFNSELPQLVRGKIESIKLGRLNLKNVNGFFTQMDHINDLYSRLKLPRITGILGSDVLLEHNAVIDFGNRVIWFEKK